MSPTSRRWMHLPLPDLAVVELAKIRDYLLSSSHPVGRHKARYFAALGYWPVHVAALARDLRRIARHGTVTASNQTPYGTKYCIRGILKSPSGREDWIDTIWIVRPNDPRPHLITAYPGAEP